MKNDIWYVGEIADYFQVSTAAVNKWDLPPPAGSTKTGKFWNPTTVKKWYQKTLSGEIQRTKNRAKS